MVAPLVAPGWRWVKTLFTVDIFRRLRRSSYSPSQVIRNVSETSETHTRYDTTIIASATHQSLQEAGTIESPARTAQERKPCHNMHLPFHSSFHKGLSPGVFFVWTLLDLRWTYRSPRCITAGEPLILTSARSIVRL